MEYYNDKDTHEIKKNYDNGLITSNQILEMFRNDNSENNIFFVKWDDILYHININYTDSCELFLNCLDIIILRIKSSNCPKGNLSINEKNIINFFIDKIENYYRSYIKVLVSNGIYSFSDIFDKFIVNLNMYIELSNISNDYIKRRVKRSYLSLIEDNNHDAVTFSPINKLRKLDIINNKV